MRTYFYALPLIFLLPACGGSGDCGGDEGFRCAPLPETATATEGVTDTDDPTGTGTGTDTDEPTGTGGETSTTDDTTSTTDDTTSTTGETSTTDETSTTESSTGETTGGPIVGDPATHGEACAPDDGPAVEFKIDLAERTCDSDWPEDVPLFRIALFKPVAELDVGEHPLAGGWGFAWWDDGDGTPESTDQGVVVITEITGDGLRGTYEVTLPDNTVLSGAFDSLYCPADALCG
ncbi:hypothetical protein [Nannocystis radixulma]|uniref:Lipoprotein n=1 Tax=Nannocystis radixulma TaxID=2995305 RepID=A0ABT5BA77_9BACT|nr:hypothetical protein [Nannocystis radixulma]MDC0671042.1 hypothetical protein [Nannocystis radixulma]